MSLKQLAHFSTLLAAVSVACSIALFSLWLTQDKPYNPLGEYPIQEIVSTTATTVTVRGVKCVDVDVAVDIVGEFNWFRIVPPGFGTTPIGGAAVRVPGCQPFEFVNTIPSEVLAVNNPDVDLWYITGTEWPIDPATGQRGVSRTWRTENFGIPSG